MYEALDTDEPGEVVPYPRLFDDDSDMNQVRDSPEVCMHEVGERLCWEAGEVVRSSGNASMGEKGTGWMVTARPGGWLRVSRGFCRALPVCLQSMFAETVRGQCLAERLEYLQVRRVRRNVCGRAG